MGREGGVVRVAKLARQSFRFAFGSRAGCQAAECGTRAGNDKYA